MSGPYGEQPFIEAPPEPTRVRMPKTFKVKVVGQKRADTVLADYVVHKDGWLVFRFSMRGDNYPEFVKAYADGLWVSVEQVRK